MSTAVAGVTGARVPVVVRETIYGTGSDDPMVAFAPAIVAFFIYFFVYLLTGVSFLRERTGGTLERLMATPVTRGEVVTGYTLGFGLFAMIQVAVLLAWALGTIHVPAIGPLPEFAIGLGIPVVGQPAARLPGRGGAGPGRREPRDLPVDLRAHRAPGDPVHPDRAGPPVPALGRAVPRQQPARDPPAARRDHAAGLRGGRAAPRLHRPGADLASAALRWDILVLAVVAVLFAFVASRTIRRDVV